MTTTVACPFALCGAPTVLVVDELQAPGSVVLVPRLVEHQYVRPGAAADGQICPASLMAWPLTAECTRVLDDLAEWMAAPPVPPASDADLWFGSGRRHSLEPHPDTDTRWFRDADGGGAFSWPTNPR